ncbi:MAG: hypothetical protein AB7K09_21080 [Planctomycetota bacterium]
MRRHLLLASVTLLTALAAAACSPAAGNKPAADNTPPPPPPGPGVVLANKCGMHCFCDVARISFTFNVQKPDGSVTSRHWSWQPTGDVVTFGQGDAAKTWTRAGLTDEQRPDDQRFINDQYWLLFPLHLLWDNATVTDDGQQPLPIGDGKATARRVTVTYPKEGGYTPGDIYELYVDAADRIVQWNHRHGGGADGRAMTWDDYHTLGPLELSLSHYTADRKFRVWFTDVEVTLTDGTVAKASAG